MTAEIRPFPGSASSNKRLELVAKLEGHQDVVNFAILLKNEEGVISTGEDKLVINFVFSLKIQVNVNQLLSLLQFPM